MHADTKQTGLQPLALPNLLTQPPQEAITRALPNQTPIQSPSLPLPQKRKLFATDLEILDSEGEDDEDYGWAEEDDENIPPMPPQWQGSEDILVPPAGELEDDNEKIEEEDEGRLGEEADEGGGVESRGRREIVEDSEDELAF
jgi:hypothetical protein